MVSCFGESGVFAKLFGHLRYLCNRFLGGGGGELCPVFQVLCLEVIPGVLWGLAVLLGLNYDKLLARQGP